MVKEEMAKNDKMIYLKSGSIDVKLPLNNSNIDIVVLILKGMKREMICQLCGRGIIRSSDPDFKLCEMCLKRLDTIFEKDHAGNNTKKWKDMKKAGKKTRLCKVRKEKIDMNNLKEVYNPDIDPIVG